MTAVMSRRLSERDSNAPFVMISICVLRVKRKINMMLDIPSSKWRSLLIAVDTVEDFMGVFILDIIFISVEVVIITMVMR